MTDQQMEDLVERIIQRLRPPVLVMVTAAAGYRHAIRQSLHGPVARRVHDALLSGLPVLALRYHCDPASELNQLRGAQPDSAYAGHMQATLARLAECGIALCTMNELLEKLASGREAAAPSASGPRRYLTVTDVVNNPALACAPEAQLTDAAIDFLKNRKKEPYLK